MFDGSVNQWDSPSHLYLTAKGWVQTFERRKSKRRYHSLPPCELASQHTVYGVSLVSGEPESTPTAILQQSTGLATHRVGGGGAAWQMCSSRLKGLQTLTPAGFLPLPPTGLQYWCTAFTHVKLAVARDSHTWEQTVLCPLTSTLTSGPVVRAYQEEKPGIALTVREQPPAGKGQAEPGHHSGSLHAPGVHSGWYWNLLVRAGGLATS